MPAEQRHTEISFDPQDWGLLEEAEAGRFAPLAQYELNLQAHRLSLIGAFDVLLCLPTLRGVEHLPFQIETARKVMRRFKGRALLCDEVGLGKTIEAGMVLKEYVLRGLVGRCLILTPPGLVAQWREELAQKFSLPFVAHEDEAFAALGQGAWGAFPFVIASLPTAKREPHAAAILGLRYDLVIVDEAHRLRRRETVNWQFVNALDKKFLLLLTATPVQNDLEELYNLVTLLVPGQLHTLRRFRREFVARGGGRQPKNTTALRQLLAECMVRNTRSAVQLALPRRTARTVRMEPTPGEATLYGAVSDFVRRHSGRLSRLALRTLQTEAGSSPHAVLPTLRRMTEHPLAGAEEVQRLVSIAQAVQTSAKEAALLHLLQATPEKVLVFSKYLATLDRLAEILSQQDIPFALYHGGLTSTQKDLAVATFEGSARVLLASDAAGEGRNLQFCRVMVNYDLPWNPMRIEQRVGRIHRIGQHRGVFIYNLVARGTIEDHLLRVLDEKINLFELVVGEVEMILGETYEDRDFEEAVMDLWVSSQDEAEFARKVDALGEQLSEAKDAYARSLKVDREIFGDDLAAS